MKRDGDLVVFYDGNCSLCTESARYTTRLDWFGRIQFLSFRDVGVFEAYVLAGNDVENRIYSVALQTGRTFSGIHTVLQIFRRIPTYWLLVPFVWLSIHVGLGQSVYDWIAKRRNLIPIGKCSNGACSLGGRDDETVR